MKNRVARTAVTVLITLAVIAAAALAFMYSGIYNVAATAPHTGLTRWALHTIMERSVAARADRVPDPPATDSVMLAEGFEHYHAMCVACHGAPGVERGELGRGMTPEPPDLAEEAEELGTKELFWITRNGIKVAGMPAFGPTHDDEQIWGIVAFLERLPEMSPADYRSWVDRYAASGEEGGHTHAPGTPAHDH